MRRYSRSLLAAFATLAALLVLVCVMLVVRKPAPDSDDADDDEADAVAASASVQVRQFPADFGSLASLVPRGGGAPRLAQAPAGPAGTAAVAASAAPAEPTPVTHGDQYRDATWLKAQGDKYTLQVLGAHSEDAVKQFIAGQKDVGQYHYFRSQQAGEEWFVVVYGSYADHDQAEAAAAGLDLGLNAKPFPKAFGAYAAEADAGDQAPAPLAASQGLRVPMPPSP